MNIQFTPALMLIFFVCLQTWGQNIKIKFETSDNKFLEYQVSKGAIPSLDSIIEIGSSNKVTDPFYFYRYCHSVNDSIILENGSSFSFECHGQLFPEQMSSTNLIKKSNYRAITNRWKGIRTALCLPEYGCKPDSIPGLYTHVAFNLYHSGQIEMPRFHDFAEQSKIVCDEIDGKNKAVQVDFYFDFNVKKSSLRQVKPLKVKMSQETLHMLSKTFKEYDLEFLIFQNNKIKFKVECTNYSNENDWDKIRAILKPILTSKSLTKQE